LNLQIFAAVESKRSLPILQWDQGVPDGCSKCLLFGVNLNVNAYVQQVICALGSMKELFP
jgi:hypothetical protein